MRAISTLSKALAAIAMLTSTSALAQSSDRGWMWDHWGWGGMMVGGGLMMLVVWGGIVLLVVVLIRWLGGFGPLSEARTVGRPTPFDILKERYARGEIDKIEYEERRNTLNSTS